MSQASRHRLDRDLVLSLVYDYLLEAAGHFTGEEVDAEHQCNLLFMTITRRRLLSDYSDERRVFGLTCTARRMRKYRKQDHVIEQYTRQPETFAVTRDTTGDFDFLDGFSNAERDFVFLLLAGYTQVELITEFGFTRGQLATLKGRIEHVYSQR